MTALVTGGTGFIGSHLVQRLLAAGQPVRCLVRNRHKIRWLEGLDVELVEGDCSDADTLPAAVSGVRFVYHVAGVSWAARQRDFFRHNALGTRDLLEACMREAPDLQRFVLVSSQAAAGPAVAGRPVVESDPARPISPYGASKLAAERYALRYKTRLPITIIRPSAVYGPRDTAFLSYFRLVRRGILLEFGPGERLVSLCHVADLVELLYDLANSNTSSGSVYFIADAEPYRWVEVEKFVCAQLGVTPKKWNIPGWLLNSLGFFGQAYSLVSGRPVTVSRARVAEIIEKRWACDTTRARQELDYAPTMTMHRGLRELVQWYEQQHWL